MRERFDFSSISNIILTNSRRTNFRTEYFYTLFDHAFLSGKISMTEESNISRILNGKRNVPKSIVNQYQTPSDFEHLKNDVSLVLENVSDISRTKEQIYKLLMDDPDLSMTFKKELSKDIKDDLLFITKCIFESITRKYNKRKKDDIKYIPDKKLDVADYLLDCHYPRVNRNFFGRDKELDTIHEQLGIEKCLFLHGIGGIGKTELALHYGKKFKKEYSNILYLQYSESLYHTVCNLNFIDDTPNMNEQTLFEMHYRFFKQLDADTLIILDNFNLLLEEDELLQDFLSLSFKLLVTTRSKIQEVPCYEVNEIESLDELKKLFYIYAPAGKDSPDIVGDIIEEVYRHTLTVEMASKTLSATGLTPEELLETLKQDRLNLSNSNKIRIQKDTMIKKATPKEHLAKLFQLQNLPIGYRIILQHIRLLPDSGIPKKLFCEWMDSPDFNMINDLISYGWIQEDEETNRISVHPFLNEVLEITEHPSLLKCRNFIENVGKEYIVNVDDEIYYRDLLGLAKSIFKTIEIDDTSLAFSLLEKILIYLEKYMFLNTMTYILEIYAGIIPMGDAYKKETATYKLYKGIEAWGKQDFKISASYFQDGITILEPLDKTNAELAIKLYHKLSVYYMIDNNQEQFVQCVKDAVELSKLYGFTDSLDYELENLILAFSSRNDYPTEVQEVFETQEMTAFIQKIKTSGKLNITKENFLKDIGKIEPEELNNHNMKLLYIDMKNHLMDMPSEAQELSVIDILGEIFSVTTEYFKKHQV